LKRSIHNPIITRDDIPDIPPLLVDATSVFNSGAIKYRDKILLMLRVQSRARETYFLMAESGDGVNFNISNEIVRFNGIESVEGEILHNYDPRITEIEGIYYIMFAMEFKDGCQLGLAKTIDFLTFVFMGITTEQPTRNGVLFPEKINDKYYRMDRPNKVQLEGGPQTGDTIWLSKSDDLFHWESVAPLIKGRYLHWDDLVGSGPPPIKTRKGWLHLYHGIAMHYEPIYQVGVLLLDLEDPSKVIARSRNNILEPREQYEMVGQVPNVVFPCGIIVEEYDEEGFAKPESEVKLYYGAADTSMCLAHYTLNELIEESILQKDELK